jgi:hypothetical protein
VNQSSSNISPISDRTEHIGDHYRLPLSLLEHETLAFQFASVSVMGDESLGDLHKMKAAGWVLTKWEPSFHPLGFLPTSEGWVTKGGLVLIQKPKVQARLSAEDEVVKAIVLEAVGRRALGSNEALFGNVVRDAWKECKAAYDDTVFRNANRDAIIQRAKRLANRAGQTADSMVSTEPPVPCRLEGFSLFFFNEKRCIPIWRLFEPLAIVQVRAEMQG